MVRFQDRGDAGRRLAVEVQALGLVGPVVILGLPRGGVPVAAEVAAATGGTLDVFVACKVGLPGHEELGIAAVAEGLERPVLAPTATEVGISAVEVEGLAAAAMAELRRRVAAYRGNAPLPHLAGCDVVVVDDGLATGITAEASLLALRRHHPKRLVLAVPVCSREAARRLGGAADDVLWCHAPDEFVAVGHWYEDFSQTTDEEVMDLLQGRPGSP